MKKTALFYNGGNGLAYFTGYGYDEYGNLQADLNNESGLTAISIATAQNSTSAILFDNLQQAQNFIKEQSSQTQTQKSMNYNNLMMGKAPLQPAYEGNNQSVLSRVETAGSNVDIWTVSLILTNSAGQPQKTVKVGGNTVLVDEVFGIPELVDVTIGGTYQTKTLQIIQNLVSSGRPFIIQEWKEEAYNAAGTEEKPAAFQPNGLQVGKAILGSISRELKNIPYAKYKTAQDNRRNLLTIDERVVLDPTNFILRYLAPDTQLQITMTLKSVATADIYTLPAAQ